MIKHIVITGLFLWSGCTQVTRQDLNAIKATQEEQGKAITELRRGLNTSNAFLNKLIEIDPQAQAAVKAMGEKKATEQGKDEGKE